MGTKDIKEALQKAKIRIAKLHPDWNIFQISKYLTGELYNRTGQCTPIILNELIHYTPLPNTRNVRCLNGSAHVLSSSDLKDVTCPLCVNPFTAHSFWSEKRKAWYQKERTKVEQKIWAGKF